MADFFKSAKIFLNDGPFAMEKIVEVVNSINNLLFYKYQNKKTNNYLKYTVVSLFITTNQNSFCTKFTSSGEIAELEQLFKKRRKKNFWK
jgi:hypothetical protein